jgi:uncharacterized protein YaaN involved in tellurite resistance
MIDPVSAIGMATAAYNGIKKAIETGKEISEMGSTLNQWATSLSDLDFAHKQTQNPPFFKKMFGASEIEQNALEVWGQKQKAKEMRDELRSYISLYYGPSAWDEIVRIESKMRKERKEAIYEAEERKQKMIELLAGIGLSIVAALILFVIFYFIGKSQGKW